MANTLLGNLDVSFGGKVAWDKIQAVNSQEAPFFPDDQFSEIVSAFSKKYFLGFLNIH
jgi:hypothetical protein